MEANLYEPGDSVKYTVTVQNKGNIDAKLENVITNVKQTMPYPSKQPDIILGKP